MEERKKRYKKLEKLLNTRGITAYRLAKDLDFSPVVFSDWKSGKSMPKADKLKLVADYFGVEIEYFLE